MWRSETGGSGRCDGDATPSRSSSHTRRRSSDDNELLLCFVDVYSCFFFSNLEDLGCSYVKIRIWGLLFVVNIFTFNLRIWGIVLGDWGIEESMKRIGLNKMAQFEPVKVFSV